jgi:ethanolamine utilization protein EutN
VKLCTVIGRVIATSKHPCLEGRTLLVLRAPEGRGDPAEPLQLAVDGVGARVGDEVIVTESGAAGREVTGMDFPPVRSVIVGIVD